MDYTALEYATLMLTVACYCDIRSFNDDTSASVVAKCRVKLETISNGER